MHGMKFFQHCDMTKSGISFEFFLFRIVAVEQNRIMALTFHPELTSDLRWHRYFLHKIITHLTEEFE